jgi:hypothetical protein
MRSLVVPVIAAALACLYATIAAAQPQPAYYCDPLHVYYRGAVPRAVACCRAALN